MDATTFEGDHLGRDHPGLTGLRRLADENSPELLEAGVRISSELLEKIKMSVQGSYEDPVKVKLIQSIETAQSHFVTKRTVIGVLGVTGSGKSSIINAIADEEFIVPTNCARACTAAVTELAYNHSSDPDKLYRAEIEFISKDDWTEELTNLFGDLSDADSGPSKTSYGGKPTAQSAKEKLVSVYPKLADSENILATSTPAALTNDPSVLEYLDTVKTIHDKSPQGFYKQLQKYVDSKENVVGQQDDELSEMELWPLIKVVRVFLKSDALSTGLVLVDLPGVQDFNAARGAVAANYLKECTAFWIVAPILRAIDDKPAQELLGDTFKRQLQMDGSLGNVVFICSKTDDISNTEVKRSLSSNNPMVLEFAEKKKKLKSLNQQFKTLERELRELQFEEKKVAELIDDINDTLDDQNDDETISVKIRTPKKRKIKTPSRKGRKRARLSGRVRPDSDEDRGLSSSTETDDEGVPRESITLDEARERLKSLKAEKSSLKEKTKSVREHKKVLKAATQELEPDVEDLKHAQTALLIQHRNDQVVPTIQDQFAAGFRDMDMGAADADDEENFNPDEDLRDYDELAESLTVFCVSSRAYQKLNGRFTDDQDVAGFSDEKDTQIPQLRVHAKNLTVEARVKASKKWLNEVRGLLNSLCVWIAVGEHGLQLPDDEKALEANALEASLTHLHRDLIGIVKKAEKTCRGALDKQLLIRFPRAEKHAVYRSVGTVSGWLKPPQEQGLRWGTLKATCRRRGVFNGSAGFRDFNEELAKPLKSGIGPGWETVFTSHLPVALEGYTAEIAAVLAAFHQEVVERPAIKAGASPASLNLVGEQAYTLSQDVTNDTVRLWNTLLDMQKGVNRKITPAIMRAMDNLYSEISGSGGGGVLNFARGRMNTYINENREVMFAKAATKCEERITSMYDTLAEDMLKKIDAVFAAIRDDYMNIVTGSGTSQDQKEAGKNLSRLISSADLEFNMALLTVTEKDSDSQAEGQTAVPSPGPDSGPLDAQAA